MTPQEARNAYRRQYRKNMTPEQRKREQEYKRQWRRNHPELVKAAQDRYWSKRAASNILQADTDTDGSGA